MVVSELFELFDNVKNEIGIVDWGIKMTTLEDGKRKPGTSFFFNLCSFQPFPLISFSLLSLQYFLILLKVMLTLEMRWVSPGVLFGFHANAAINQALNDED